ncbi:MAG: DUF2062 domain-containing protein [Proteobacteria bacterium]|nr:DUF2062 domain-containing protein [Pseudomonadota bacterium]
MSSFFKVEKNRRRGVHRKRRSFLEHAREWLWPSSGWFAFMRWLELVLKRKSGSAHEVALGFAAGVFISFLPINGFHFLGGALVAYVLGGSILASAIGTFVGNPWTFPFIWLAALDLGNYVLGVQNPHQLPESFSLKTVFGNFSFWAEHYIWPMMVGGFPLGIIAAALFYFPLRYNIERYRERRQQMLNERRRLLVKLAQVKEASKEKIFSLRDGK